MAAQHIAILPQSKMIIETMDKIKLIMIMAMQRSGTTALFATLSTDPTLASHEESPDSAIYDDYYLRPESEIRAVLRSYGSRVLLKPVRETERRTLVSIIDEYAEYDLSILWLYRDPVNVVYSYGEMGWLDSTFVDVIALEWVARNRMVIELPEDYREKVMLVRYEELISDPFVLETLNRKLGIRARSRWRRDSNAGRSRMPITVQAEIDALTSVTVVDLDCLRSSWRENTLAANWNLRLAEVASRLIRRVPARLAHLRPGDRRGINDISTVPYFASERFERKPHDCLRRWRECRIHRYGAYGNVRLLSEYNQVSNASADSRRFVFQSSRLQKVTPDPAEEQLRDAIAGAAIRGSDETVVSSLEGLAHELITRQAAEGQFDLVNVCRLAIASMFYQLLGVESSDPVGFFERTIRGDSIDTLSCNFSRGGWLSRLATQTSLSNGELKRFLMFGSYFHYVTAIFANSAIHYILGEPGLVEEIRRAPERFPSTFNELVRLAYPLLVVERFTRVEVEVAGCKIPAQNLIYLAIGASNRDPAAFKRPDEFIMERDSSTTNKVLTGYSHASFGCSHWEDLGHFVCRTFLKALFTTFPILEPINPLGESKFTITQSSGDFRKVLQIPFIRYLKSFEVKFQTK